MDVQVSSGTVYFLLEGIPHVIQARFFSIFHVNFDHVEAPWQIAGAEALEPGICAAFDQGLFWLIHGIQRPDFASFAPRFDFHEEQQFPIACDDVDFAFFGSPEIPREDPGTFRA